MIKVADIYVPEDGCGPYTISVCGGSDSSYFKVIGKELYFDEDKFNEPPAFTTTTQTTTIAPGLINMFFTAGPYNDSVYGIGSACVFNFGGNSMQISVIVGNQPIANPLLYYQWQEKVNNSWVDMSGETSRSLTNYRKYNEVRVKVTYQNKTIISQAVRGYCAMV